MKHYLLIPLGYSAEEAFRECEGFTCERHIDLYKNRTLEVRDGDVWFGDIEVRLTDWEPCSDCHDEYAQSLYEDSMREMAGRLEEMMLPF